jgi:ribosomal protein S18 acetylase RimI-like enzyme
MRETLVEVLGRERGESLYSMEWLRDRVSFHLDRERTACVWVAETGNEIVGHAIVRAEDTEARAYGLFSTIYVVPALRRRQVASALLVQGEAWMWALGLKWAATNTSHTNQKLIRLFEKHGYEIVLREEEFVQLARDLTDQ